MTKPARTKVATHGTQGGYNMHRYYGEKACTWCRQAHSTYTAIQTKARNEVANRHPDELAAVVARLKKEAGI